MKHKKYKHIFFDLDHTLWDFETNSNLTLQELIVKYKIDQVHGFDFEECMRSFHEANHRLWSAYNKGEISAEQLRNDRFEASFVKYDFDKEDIKHVFNEDYLAICPYKSNLMPQAKEILDFLYAEYFNMYVLTNGFEHVQLIKLTSSQVFHYFEDVFTVKDFGVRKPSPHYFENVLREINATADECLMVGDSLEVDVLAAMQVGIDGVWYNPVGQYAANKPTYEISQLIALKSIVY